MRQAGASRRLRRVHANPVRTIFQQAETESFDKVSGFAAWGLRLVQPGAGEKSDTEA